MKVPLRYQASEYDCGPMAILNALNYLMDSDDIPPNLIQKIFHTTMDDAGADGTPGARGTSRNSIASLATWINEQLVPDLKCIHYANQDVAINLIVSRVESGTVALIRTFLDGVQHYVVITRVAGERVYLWDSYFAYENNDSEAELVMDKHFEHNRIVTYNRMMSETNEDYALGPKDGRQCIIFIAQ